MFKKVKKKAPLAVPLNPSLLLELMPPQSKLSLL